MCEKCEAPIDMHTAFVCRRCGWYASIGSFVEIDQAWEEGLEDSPQIAASSFRVPAWGWTMLVCVSLVVGESIAARFLTAEESAARTMWSITQLLVGGVTALLCHLIAFIMLSRETTDIGLLDMVLKPVKPWIARVQELPAYQWLCHFAVSGVVAVVMAFTVIGGLPYEKLWDWGFEKPVQQNLMGAIMDRAKKVEGREQSLEDAVQQFAGQAGVDDADGKPSSPAKSGKDSAAPQERSSEDCLIIGYRTNSEGLAYLLVLAGEHRGKLQYVGQVTLQLSVKQLRDLSDQLAAAQSIDPFVAVQMEGVTWVKPKFACRVSYARKGNKGGLYDAKFESLLGEVAIAGPSRP